MENKHSSIKKCFVIFSDYLFIEEEKQAYVRLVCKTSDGKKFILFFSYDPYFFIKSAHLDILKSLNFNEKIKNIEEVDLKTMLDKQPVVKITLYSPKDVPIIRDALEEVGVETYEADIRFVQRFFMDKDITTSFEFSYSPKDEISLQEATSRRMIEHLPPFSSLQDFTFVMNPTLIKTHTAPNLNELCIASVDIETDPPMEKLLSISIYVNNNEAYALLLYPGVAQEKLEQIKQNIKTNISSIEYFKNLNLNKFNIFVFNNEIALLRGFLNLIKEIDPDIVLGWNFIDFDLNFLRDRFRKHSLSFALGRDGSAVELRVAKKYLKKSTAKAFGRQILDGIYLLRDAYIDLEDYKLETAGRAFVGEGKLFENIYKDGKVMEFYRDKPYVLIAYNVIDCWLAYNVVEKSDALNIVLEKSSITGLELDRVGGSVSSFDNLYLRNLRKRGYVAKTTKYDEKEESIVGAYVKEPTPGLYTNALVLDFKSLYPSIMKTFNIDPLTFVGNINVDAKRSKNICKDSIVAPNGACFLRHEEGIVSEILTELWTRREEAKKKGEKARSYALKILMNSMFGVLANSSCRYYNLDIAGAITSFGRLIVQNTAKFLTEKGYKVIYSDTDSVFVDVNVHDTNRAIELGRLLEKEINDYYKGWVEKEYGRKSYLEIEFEKCYTKLLFFRTRSGIEGAKKKYAGLIKIDSKEQLDLVGVEAIRRDWTPLARIFQTELLMRLFKNQPLEEFISSFINKLRAGHFDDLLVYKKALRKPISAYTKTTPPHVKAAKLLDKLPEDGIIEYVITTQGPEPVGKIKHKIDYDHYVEKQLLPILNSIIDATGLKIDLSLLIGKQTNLNSFF